MPREWFRINSDEQERLAKVFRDRIEQELGNQVLDNILSRTGSLVFIGRLDMGAPPMHQIRLMHNSKQQGRLKNLYDVELVSEEELTKDIEEAERLEKREMELAVKWRKHHNADQSVPEEPSGDIP